MQASMFRKLDNLSPAPSGSRMVLAMHFLEPPKRQMRVDLRGGDVGVA